MFVAVHLAKAERNQMLQFCIVQSVSRQMYREAAKVNCIAAYPIRMEARVPVDIYGNIFPSPPPCWGRQALGSRCTIFVASKEQLGSVFRNLLWEM